MRQSDKRWPGPFVRTTVVLWFAIAAPAMADCIWEGESYPEGTRIGDLVCEDGEWVIRHRTPPPLVDAPYPLHRSDQLK